MVVHRGRTRALRAGGAQSCCTEVGQSMISEEKRQLYRDAGLLFLLSVLIAHFLVILIVGPWKFDIAFATWLLVLSLGTGLYGLWVIRKDKELLRREINDKSL
ncbi:MAG: hypothetical protein QXI19_12910 [Candidatus Caldarchaeum sp.]